MKLRTHLAVVVLGALLPMVAFSAAMLFWVHQQTRRATERGLVDTARAVSVAVDREVGGTIAALKILAASEHLVHGRLGAFSEVAQQAVTTQPTWQNVVLYAPDGTVLVNTLLPRGLPPRPGGNAEPVSRAIRDRTAVVSDLFTGRLTSRPILSVVVPVFEGRSPTYALAAIVPAANLVSVLREQELPADWVATIIDGNGIIVARTHAMEQWQGKPATPIFVARARGAASGSFRDVSRDGVAVYGAYSRSRFSGWTVGLGAPVAAVEPAWRASMGAMAGAAAACLVVAGVLATVFARRIAAGIRTLATSAHALGRGEVPAESAPSLIAEVRDVERELAGAARERAEAVTQGARAREALARSTERLNLLHEIDRAIIAAKAPVEIAEAVLRPLRDLLDVPRAIVNLFDEAAGQAEWLAAIGRRQMVLEPAVRFPLDLMGDLDALRRGETQVVDVTERAPSPHVDALRASGVDVYMVVPMIAGGELIGGLSFGGARREFPEEHISIAREVAAQLAIAIAQTRLYERVTAQSEELEARVQERTRALSAEVAERRRAQDEADRASRIKSEFLANMSHELRTPLNGIIGFAQLMHDGKVGPVSGEHREYLGDILTSARHLLQLINDILDLTKVEAGRLEFHSEPLDAGRIMREVADVVRGLAARKRIALETFVDPALGPLVLDPDKLKQVLYNYLSNAIKFTPDGGRVTVRARPEGADAVRFEVEDTGIGIDAQDLPRLFREFEQIDPGPAKRHEGTGLGLALTKRLVEAQGGRVGARSTPGEGSLFFAILPRSRP